MPENYSRWNPQNHIKNWKTPQLVIHGGKDYRLTESEGLGVFNTLQRLGVPSRFVYFESENHWVLVSSYLRFPPRPTCTDIDIFVGSS